jgi:hypothetical protein
MAFPNNYAPTGLPGDLTQTGMTPPAPAAQALAPVAPPPAPKPEGVDAPVEYETGSPSDQSMYNSAMAEAIQEQNEADQMHPQTLRRGNGMELLGEGVNPHIYGGEEGLQNLKQLTNPEGTVTAIRNAQNAEEQKNKALESHFSSEKDRESQALAAMQFRRQQDAVEEQRRQAELDQQAQAYTQELATSGKFWSNPGNIISAIAFSLMPMAGGAPDSGVKLINAAIDREMAGRRAMAEQHLGELRSSLAGYRRIAGDRQAGDLLAEAEMRRMAAMEVQRIAAQYESPIAKAKSEIVVNQLQKESLGKYMQLYAQAYKNPQFVPEAIRKNLLEGGRDGSGYRQFSDAGTKGMPATSANPEVRNSAAVGNLGNSPTTATTRGGGNLSSSQIAEYAAAGSAGYTKQIEARAARGELKRQDAINYITAMNERRLSSFLPPGSPQYNKQMQADFQKVQEDSSKIAAAAAPYAEYHQSLRNVQANVNYISNYCKLTGKNPDEFMSKLGLIVGSGKAEKLRDLQEQFTGAPGSKEEQAAVNARRAVGDLYQKFYAVKGAYMTKNLGANQSLTEVENLGKYIQDNPSFRNMAGFISSESSKAAAGEMNAVRHAPSAEARILYLASQQKDYIGTKLTDGGIKSARESNAVAPSVSNVLQNARSNPARDKQ